MALEVFIFLNSCTRSDCTFWESASKLTTQQTHYNSTCHLLADVSYCRNSELIRGRRQMSGNEVA